ncbi:hypothetical protein [Nannocystis bainbridge]|uniref:Secreted protein n=1 Tax=Nannocystis bainbridge TaxID=2995303 RepID=A0ABT5DU04_9BACT|nr:hypothetical protein [Nannocystis bainbridge]MDC0717128.1 hypothetical protein [Nannocystis bainbridge]
MPAVFASFLRCLVVLSLWLGAAVAASSAEAAVPGTPDLRSDIHLRLVELLGAAEFCGDEDDPDAEVLCGGDLLADLVVDPSVLKLSRGSCSRLLEVLFKRAVCDPTDETCGKLQRGGLPPRAPPDLLGPSSAAVAALLRDEWSPQRVALTAARPRDDPPLLSRTTCPEAPPPRVAPV